MRTEAYEQFLEANHKRAEQEAQSKKQAKIAYYKKQLEIQETKNIDEDILAEMTEEYFKKNKVSTETTSPKTKTTTPKGTKPKAK